MTRLNGRINPTLPGAVVVNGGSRHPLSGFLSTTHQPLAVGNPSDGLKNVRMLWGMTEEKFKKGLNLSQKLDRSFTKKYDLDKVNAYSDMYDDAVRLMKSKDLKAFDLKEESESTRESYGSDNFGQGVLLARRLVERQARLLKYKLRWDTHQNNFSRVPRCAIQIKPCRFSEPFQSWIA